MYARHDKLDFVVHRLVKHFCLLPTGKVDVWRLILPSIEVPIGQAVEGVSLNLSVILSRASDLVSDVGTEDGLPPL